MQELTWKMLAQPYVPSRPKRSKLLLVEGTLCIATKGAAAIYGQSDSEERLSATVVAPAGPLWLQALGQCPGCARRRSYCCVLCHSGDTKVSPSSDAVL